MVTMVGVMCVRGAAIAALVLATAVLLLPTPASAQGMYEWKLRCNGDGVVSAGWNWTTGGQLIPGAGGSATCSGDADLNGTGERPANADGFVAGLSIDGFCVYFGGPPCSDSDSVAASFDPAKSFGTHLSVQTNVKFPNFFCGFSAISPEARSCKDIHISGSGHFALNS